MVPSSFWVFRLRGCMTFDYFEAVAVVCSYRIQNFAPWGIFFLLVNLVQ